MSFDLSKKSDKELLDILDNIKDYREEFIIEVKKEANNRGFEDINSIHKNIEMNYIKKLEEFLKNKFVYKIHSNSLAYLSDDFCFKCGGSNNVGKKEFTYYYKKDNEYNSGKRLVKDLFKTAIVSLTLSKGLDFLESGNNISKLLSSYTFNLPECNACNKKRKSKIEIDSKLDLYYVDDEYIYFIIPKFDDYDIKLTEGEIIKDFKELVDIEIIKEKDQIKYFSRISD